jgi:hypothetical protein
VLRPASRLLLLATAVLSLSACTTFTDDNVAARVGDVELSYSDFERRVRSVDDSGADAIPGDLGRGVVANWIALELARDSGLLERYEAGPQESGVLCVFAVNVADAAAADAAVASLRAGADWDEFVTETDPLARLSGRQECLPTTAIGDLISQIGTATTDDPYRALTFPTPSFAVIRIQPVDELSGFELLQVTQALDPDLVDSIVDTATEADVYVDPRLGQFNPVQFSVTPLG